ncbi:MAG: dTDP-4-dehydrorhamnose 3,5-epimerase [Flavobacteriales bacterium]|nr:dTDP-4-dehydrorhamnose 3,5-epimerase [Flavobacteriales bacterium]
MKIHSTPIEGLLVIEPTVFEDERGHFFESYRHDALKKNSFTCEFVQDNESLSQKDVLRGLHFQRPPYSQDKLVRAVKGSIWDVAVDLRKDSETYGQHFGVELSEKNKMSVLVPIGFAHGFVTLEDNTLVNYKCSNYYNKESEYTLLWNDESLGINWKVEHPIMSDKDLRGEAFVTFESMF